MLLHWLCGALFAIQKLERGDSVQMVTVRRAIWCGRSALHMMGQCWDCVSEIWLHHVYLVMMHLTLQVTNEHHFPMKLALHFTPAANEQHIKQNSLFLKLSPILWVSLGHQLCPCVIAVHIDWKTLALHLLALWVATSLPWMTRFGGFGTILTFTLIYCLCCTNSFLCCLCFHRCNVKKMKFCLHRSIDKQFPKCHLSSTMQMRQGHLTKVFCCLFKSAFFMSKWGEFHCGVHQFLVVKESQVWTVSFGWFGNLATILFPSCAPLSLTTIPWDLASHCLKNQWKLLANGIGFEEKCGTSMATSWPKFTMGSHGTFCFNESSLFHAQSIWALGLHGSATDVKDIAISFGHRLHHLGQWFAIQKWQFCAGHGGFQHGTASLGFCWCEHFLQIFASGQLALLLLVVMWFPFDCERSCLGGCFCSLPFIIARIRCERNSEAAGVPVYFGWWNFVPRDPANSIDSYCWHSCVVPEGRARGTHDRSTTTFSVSSNLQLHHLDPLHRLLSNQVARTIVAPNEWNQTLGREKCRILPKMRRPLKKRLCLKRATAQPRRHPHHCAAARLAITTLVVLTSRHLLHKALLILIRRHKSHLKATLLPEKPCLQRLRLLRWHRLIDRRLHPPRAKHLLK